MDICRYNHYGLVDTVDVIRYDTVKDDGCNLVRSNPTYVYQAACAKVFTGGNRRTQLAYHNPSGIEKEEVLQVQFSPSVPNIRECDYVRVYWGTGINVSYDDAIPCGGPPYLLFETEAAGWDGSGWVGIHYSLVYAVDHWSLTYDDVEIFAFPEYVPQTSNPLRLSWSALETPIDAPKPGPYQDYEILKYQHHRDLCGAFHHTQAWVELRCTDEAWEDSLEGENWEDNL